MGFYNFQPTPALNRPYLVSTLQLLALQNKRGPVQEERIRPNLMYGDNHLRDRHCGQLCEGAKIRWGVAFSLVIINMTDALENKNAKIRNQQKCTGQWRS